MFGHLNDHFIGNRGNISSCQSTIRYMDRITDAGSNDLCIDILCHIKNICDLTYQINTVSGNIINSSKERRYVSCTCPGCQKRLVCRKDQRHIGLDTL